MPLFKPVSASSVRTACAAFELAKNEELIAFFQNCNVKTSIENRHGEFCMILMLLESFKQKWVQ
jgi:hypothetical protein